MLSFTLFYLAVFCIVVSKSEDDSAINSKSIKENLNAAIKLPACQACKVMTTSFKQVGGNLFTTLRKY